MPAVWPAWTRRRTTSAASSEGLASPLGPAAPVTYDRRAHPPGPRGDEDQMKMTTSRASALAFLTAAATLFLQVLVHRMVSAKLLNNYAFLVISLTMLGFALSGVILSFFLRRFLDRLDDASAICAALFTISVVGASMAFYRTDAAAQFGLTRPGFVIAFLRWMPFALLFAIPFACCGLILGSLLAPPHLSARRVYFPNLIGLSSDPVAGFPDL